MRWRRRQRLGLPLWQTPGPKKSLSLDWAVFYPLLRQLEHGPVRTQGTGTLYQRFAWCLSRRQLNRWVQELRQDRLDTTEYGADGCQIIPVQDLASRYRFQPLVADRLDGLQIARHLEMLFRQHGAPLLLKRDNGSPFNNQYMDPLLARYRVLPLNNPPACPRYNGAVEKGIRDLKEHLDQRWGNIPTVPSHRVAQIEASVQELNHRPRRCLKGPVACAVFHDDAHDCVGPCASAKLFSGCCSRILGG